MTPMGSWAAEVCKNHPQTFHFSVWLPTEQVTSLTLWSYFIGFLARQAVVSLSK